MTETFALLTLAPPICILLCAFLTRQTILSLIIGILLAALIATNFAPIAAIKLTFSCILTNLEFNKFFSSQHFLETWNLFICIFLLVLGIIVALLQHSGGAYAYAEFIKKYIHNKRGAETSSLILSSCLFIDDYFNSLTVGSIMYPLTDANKVPRVKLALLVHSMSSPLVILCPFSSWAAAIMGYLRENGIEESITESTFVLANPLVVYFHILPFVFYSFILILSIWYITQARIAFSAIKRHENIAEDTGNLFGGKQPAKFLIDQPREKAHPHTTLVDFLLPIAMLIFCIILSMLHSGHWSGFGGNNDIIQAFQRSSAASALFFGGNFALLIILVFLLLRKRINVVELPQICWEGINLMLPAVVILILAWSFGSILHTELHTGEYLAKLLIGSVDLTMLPVLLFITAGLIAFTIGSAWGTAAMLFPIVIPMVPAMLGITHTPTLAEVPMLVPALGAILSGCVAGNHLSPIADTTIMSASSTRTPVMDHVHTQIPYAIPIIIATGIGFYFSAWLMRFGYVVACILPIFAGALVSIGIMQTLHILSNRHQKR